jgi:hypothetical protein
VPLTLFAFLAALVGLALTDTWKWSLLAAAVVAAGAGDAYVTRRARPRPAPRERALGAVMTCVATWLMVPPALLVLVLIVWVLPEPLS